MIFRMMYSASLWWQILSNFVVGLVYWVGYDWFSVHVPETHQAGFSLPPAPPKIVVLPVPFPASHEHHPAEHRAQCL
jgi:hypothetical protein